LPISSSHIELKFSENAALEIASMDIYAYQIIPVRLSSEFAKKRFKYCYAEIAFK